MKVDLMRLTDRSLEAKVSDFFLAALIIFLPFFWLKGYSHWYARMPQYWLWLSCAILFFALCQKNIWMKVWLTYLLGLAIYYDFIIGHPVELENGKKVLLRDFSENSLYGFATIMVAFGLMSFVKKRGELWIKVSYLFASYGMLYFWIYKTFEKKWIGGAFLALTIPLILSLCKNPWRLFLILPSLIGIVYSKSLAAILTAFVGLVVYFCLEKSYKLLFTCGILLFCLICAYLIKQYQKDDFKLMSAIEQKICFRRDVWGASILLAQNGQRRTIKEMIIGTGVRTYHSYGFMEGEDVLITHPHNEFIEVFCEYGVIGLIILLYFLIDLFFCVRAPVEYKAGLAACITHSMCYYPCRIASLGLIIIVYLGLLNKYKFQEG